MSNKQNKWMKEYSNELKITVVNECLNGVSSAFLAKKLEHVFLCKLLY